MDYAKSVFINCPFDDDFAPLFHAIVLTITALRFQPRSARESEGEAEPRITRIANGLRTSKYSLHDLSRYQGAGPDNLARFNMPLELGMAVGIRFERKEGDRPHNWAPLLPVGFIHEKFVSDLAGFDSPQYDDRKPPTLISAVALWLTLQPDYAAPTPTPLVISRAFPGYERSLKRARIQSLGVLSWPVIVEQAVVQSALMPLPGQRKAPPRATRRKRTPR